MRFTYVATIKINTGINSSITLQYGESIFISFRRKSARNKILCKRSIEQIRNHSKFKERTRNVKYKGSNVLSNSVYYETFAEC
jgi:hypothetical protein